MSVQEAQKDAQIHSSSLYLEPDFPLLGSAYFCKSRSEYELEAIQGLANTPCSVTIRWCITMCDVGQENLGTFSAKITSTTRQPVMQQVVPFA